MVFGEVVPSKTELANGNLMYAVPSYSYIFYCISFTVVTFQFPGKKSDL